MKEENKLPNVYVGQVLYREKLNNNGVSEIVEVTVDKIGKKYFYLTGWLSRYPICKKTLKHENKNHSLLNFQLYLDKQEILDKNEKTALIGVLRNFFDWRGNSNKSTLEQLRQVSKILGLS